jgi:hypothetical protein
MIGSSVSLNHSTGETQPRLHQHGREVQRFDQLRALPLGLPEDARGEIAALLNQVLSDTRILHGRLSRHRRGIAAPCGLSLLSERIALDAAPVEKRAKRTREHRDNTDRVGLEEDVEGARRCGDRVRELG